MLKLDRRESLKMLEDYGTPEHVIGHCKAVAMVATKVGITLNKKGYNLDVRLIEAASLLHDIARVEPEHEKVGAEFLRERGYILESEIVKVHMHYPEFSNVENLNETDLVCLGDRVCKYDKYVGLEERMDYVMDKAKGNAEAIEIIKKKKKEVAEFICNLEKVMNCSLDQLMRG